MSIREPDSEVGREISIELEKHIRQEFKKIKPLLNKRVKELIDIKDRYVKFPIAINGVIDMVRYDTKTKKFDQIEIMVATKGIEPGIIQLPYTAYCDEYKTVILSTYMAVKLPKIKKRRENK